MNETQWKGNDTVFKTYVKGSGKKQTDPTGTERTFQNASQFSSFGAKLNEDFIDISFDSDELSEMFWNMCGENNWKCLILENPDNGHIHSFWKDTKHRIEKSGVDKKLACGLIADIHKGSTYIPLRVKGSDRFPPSQEDDIIQEVPDELIPVNTNISLLDLSEGEGRNDSLFKYILDLQSQLQLDRDGIIRVLDNTNRFVFKDALSQQEFDTITREEAFEKPVFYSGKAFLHNVLGKYLIDKYNIVRIEGRLHIYQDNIYQENTDLIVDYMQEVIPTIKKSQKSEVLDYLLHGSPKMNYSGVNLIAFRNGILNINTDELIPFSPDYAITNKIPWDYNPNAFDEDADSFLNRIACDDVDIRSLLEECIGYCFYRENILQKAFILVGNKSNGKSTFIDVLSRILGDDNVSATDLKNIGDKFSKASCYKKLANLGADMSDDFISDSSMFKKIVSGDKIEAEFKNQPLFMFNPYVKLVFSANSIPRIKDKTGAVIRRLIIIPLNAVFSEDSADFDPDIKKKLFKQSAMEYFIMLGVKGLKRVLTQKHFTKSSKVQKELDDYEEFNNPVIGFFKDMDEGYIFRNSTKEVHLAYSAWCSENGYQAESKNQFGRTLKSLYGVESKQKTIAGKSVRMYVKTDE